MLVSGTLGQHGLPRIHDVPQLTAIFIFYQDKAKCEPLAKTWFEVRGIFTAITVVCKSLKQAVRQLEENFINISLFSAGDISSQHLNQLDQSCMYTKLIKEILLKLESNDENVKELAT